MEYSSRLPKEIRSIIGETHGDIEVSEIHSRKFFNIWNKFVEKANLKLPRVSSPAAKISPLSNFILDDRSKSIFSPKFHLRNFTKENSYINETNMDDKNNNVLNKFEWEQNDIPSRILDKEECQASYKNINERVKLKVSNARINRNFLITFDPSKVKLPN